MKLSSFCLSLAMCTATMAPTAFALDASVDFPIGQKNGNFNCTYDGSGQVHITTDKVKVKGFCAGDPNVPAPGQLQVNSDAIKDYYFSIRKSAQDSGKVTVTALDGDLHAMNCQADKGGKQAYPHGSKYCAL